LPRDPTEAVAVATPSLTCPVAAARAAISSNP
jgi:hypothetical protein